ncbi:MAG: hypothetical protein Q8R90_10375 [Bacteroidales bacterium]|nr:hypothetical protein [Bacteroidales bacterium]
MKRLLPLMLVLLLVFVSNTLFAVQVGVAANPNSTGPGDNCKYTFYERNSAGEIVILATGFGPCPKWSDYVKGFVNDFSANSEMSKVLLKAGYKKSNLKNFVIPNYDPVKQTNEKGDRRESR